MSRQRGQFVERQFLWLTDLHYEDPHSRSSSTPHAVSEDVFGPAVRFLESLTARGKRFALVAVGGDITTKGKSEGFDRFENEMLPALRNLLQRSGCLCIVPGNHDVKWGVDPDDDSYFETKFEDFEALINRHRGEISTSMIPTWKKTGGERVVDFTKSPFDPIYVDKKAKLLVLNINSAVRCGELRQGLLKLLRSNLKAPISYPPPAHLPPGEEVLYNDLIQDIAHVTPQQKAALDKALSIKQRELGIEWHEYLRVAIVHHHLGPYMKQHIDDRQYLHMVDSHSVLELLEQYDFHIALSGHTHQAYMYKYVFPSEKEVILLGGLTLGGEPVPHNGQGFRHVSVKSSRYEHTVQVKNVILGEDYGGGHGDAQSLLDAAETATVTMQIPIKSIVDRESRALGHSCDELVSCTAITREGDALRSLEYRDYFVCSSRKNRSLSVRSMELPSTSGVIDENIRVHLLGDPESQHLKKKEVIRNQRNLEIVFEPHLQPMMKVGYSISWVTLNAYAMDRLHFQRKYPPKTKHKDMEFVYETPDLPVRRLTLVAQFPHGFRFEHQPRISVVSVGDSDMREWVEDNESIQALRRLKALRYFHASNAYSLVVKAPKVGLSYRIVWTLEESHVTNGVHSVKRALTFINDNVDAGGKASAALRSALDGALSTSVGLLRDTLLRDVLTGKPWTKKLDASLMIWDLNFNPSALSLISAIESESIEGRKIDLQNKEDKFVPLLYNQSLEFGIGVAGRTLKMNRLEQWDRKQWAATKDREFKANFYEHSDQSPLHSSLISIPIHLPVDEENFKKDGNGNVYRESIPFAVINVGSTTESLPGTWLGCVGSDLEDKLNSAIQRVQHILNQRILDGLQNAGFSAS